MYYVSLPTQQENANEAADYQPPQAMETALDRATATALLTAVDDENRNEPHYSELVGDMNGNKRKRYDSASSGSSAALRQTEPEEVIVLFLNIILITMYIIIHNYIYHLQFRSSYVFMASPMVRMLLRP